MAFWDKRPLRAACAVSMALLIAAAAVPAFAEDAEATAEEKQKISELNERYEDLKAKASEIQADINKTQSEKNKKLAEKQQIGSQIDVAQQQIDVMQQQIGVLTERIDLLEETIRQKEDELVEKQAEIDDSYALFKKRVCAMSKMPTGSTVGLVLGAETYSQFVNRSEITARVAQYDKELMEDLIRQKQELADIKADIEQNKKSVENDKSEMDTKKQDLDEKKQELDVKLTEAQKQIQDISLLEQQFMADKAKYQKEMAQMQAQLDQIFAEIARRSTTETYVGGAMGHPTPNLRQISSAYGWRFGGSDFHTGVDFYGSGAFGQNILAANDGEVALACYTDSSSYGKYLIIDHGGGITTLYAHCSAVNVSVGDKVTRGQPIAQVGMTGWATGPHCHFEVRVNGKHTDPMPYLT